MERGQDQEPNPPCMMLEEDLLWDDEEFISLSTKESPNPLHESLGVDLVLEGVRAEAVEWILGAQSHHGFSVATAVLAVNYLDRFLWCFRRDTDKPWMGQLAAVSCLSLAAKVDETRVPLLLDLQVGPNSQKGKNGDLFNFRFTYQHFVGPICFWCGACLVRLFALGSVGGDEVLVRGEDDTENGAAGALRTRVEDESCDSSALSSIFC